jgi:hypothetical protein
MTSASFASALQFLSLLFDIVIVVRLLQLRLYRTYPFFFAMLCVPLILQTTLVVYGVKSHRFAHTYLWLEPVRNVLFVLVVWELFSVIFRNYAGLRSLSSWVMGVAAFVATAGLILTASPSGLSGFNHWVLARAMVRFERGVAFGLVIFIVIMLYFISRYPIKLPRNNVVLCMVYSLWFLGDSAILLVMSFLPYSYIVWENDALAVLEIASYLSWALLLSAAGEFQETRVRQNISPEREKSLIGELDAMNEVLMRAAKSISHSR